jgi:hypothetical protein
MGGTPMLVIVAFACDLVIGQVHLDPSGHEPVERLM